MSEFNLWPFLLLLFLLVSTIVFLILQRYSQKKAEQEFEKLSQTLQPVQSARHDINDRVRLYSPRDPEPYKTRSLRLKEAQSQLNHQIDVLEDKRVVLNEEIVQLKKKNLSALLKPPTVWKRIEKTAVQLQSEITTLEENLEEIKQLEEELQKLPWLVTQQARTLQSKLEKMAEILAQLEKAGLQGDTFTAAGSVFEQIKSTLADVPEQIYDLEKTAIEKEISKESIAQVHAIISTNSPVLEELQGHLKSWEITASTAVILVSQMRQAITGLEELIGQIPTQLDIAEEKATLIPIETIARNLEASAGRMEVETIPLVFQEADHVHQSVLELTSKLKRSISDLASLETLQGDLSNGFRDSSLRLAALATRNTYPVRVEGSLEKLGRLKQQSGNIANGLAQRTVSQLSKDLNTLVDLSIQHKNLDRQIDKIESDRTALATLLESAEIKRLPTWIHNARALRQEMAEYAQENWLRPDDVTTFPGALDAFVGEAERLLLSDPGQPVSEQDLDKRLIKTEQLAGEYQRLASRVEHYSKRLLELHNIELRSQETLEDQRKFLNQLRLITKSNPFLEKSILEEIDQFIKNIQTYETGLDKPEHGIVEKKARQTADLTIRIEAADFRWLELLTKNCQEQQKDLSSTLDQLDAIAHLDDPGVLETRRLLLSEEARQLTSPPRRAPAGGDELLLAFKRRSDLWQEFQSAAKSIENIHQLQKTYQETKTLRQQANQEIGELIGTNPEKRAWPPTSVTFQGELTEMRQLEKEWRELHERTGKAISMVAQYSDLGSQYKNLVERLRESSNLRNKEQQIIENLDDEIMELARPWESLQNEYRDNQGASQEIGEMLKNLDRALREIERGYLRGEMDYDEVLQEMRTIQRRVRYFQVALDDEHALDASGRVSRRR